MSANVQFFVFICVSMNLTLFIHIRKVVAHENMNQKNKIVKFQGNSNAYV